MCDDQVVSITPVTFSTQPTALERENARLRAALEWYANPNQWRPCPDTPARHFGPDLERPWSLAEWALKDAH